MQSAWAHTTRVHSFLDPDMDYNIQTRYRGNGKILSSVFIFTYLFHKNCVLLLLEDSPLCIMWHHLVMNFIFSMCNSLHSFRRLLIVFGTIIVNLVFWRRISQDVVSSWSLFFSNGSTAPWGPRPPHFSRFHDHIFVDTPHSVGLLWTRDQLVAETSTWQHTTLTSDRHPCPRRDSNPQSQ
jgi:hypothetical protein